MVAATTLSMPEVLLSFDNLIAFGCISNISRDPWNPIITNKGTLLYVALKP